MQKAIVTMVVGDRFVERWNRVADSWRAYATRHGYELICIRNPLDTSTRAESRSISWQKCLALSLPEYQSYDRLVWLDADIVINPESPDIAAKIPANAVGAVNEFETPTSAVYQAALKSWYGGDLDPFYADNASAYHRRWAPELDADGVVQGGVLVMTPRLHGEVFSRVYSGYEDKGDPRWHYEMRPLSFEIQRSCPMVWLDWRFNSLWAIWKTLLFRYCTTQSVNIKGSWRSDLLNRLVPHRIKSSLRAGYLPACEAIGDCIETALSHSFFLHFAGSSADIDLFRRKSVP